MIILGISAFYHDSAAALVKDGEIIAAAQEERFTRKKHDSRFPFYAIEYCLNELGITLSDVDYIAFYDKPFLKFERLLETYLAFAPKGFKSFSASLPVWVKDKLFQKKTIIDELKKIDSSIDFSSKLLFSEHHQSHAASAFYPSPFEKAVVITMDGVGEWATTSIAVGDGKTLTMKEEIHFPHSLGLLYSAFTYYTGFKVNSGEYKVMGLAPYGEPKYVDKIYEHLIDVKEDGSFKLNMDYFDYCTDLKMTNDKFDQLFGAPARKPDVSPLTQREMDLAASVQVVVEEVVEKLCRSAKEKYGCENLCLAGGVALNCVANGKIVAKNIFKNVWVQPAAGDAGGSLGAALASYYHHLGNERVVHPEDAMKGSYLGPKYELEDITKELDSVGAKYQVYDESDVLEKTAELLANKKAIGWFQGRMEFGPRALGGRSIIADPSCEKMQKTLNLKVKFRESFRPFAPSVLEEDVTNWFDYQGKSPYMLMVAPVKEQHRRAMSESELKLFGIEKLNVKRSSIPAITHVDYSARIQTVTEKTNSRYYHVIKKFKEKTDIPIVVNTSFNVRGEPIVCTPTDAFKCFMGTHLDALVVENCLLLKESQDQTLLERYEGKFDLD
jgi:carbamoyltransferase